MVVVGSGGDHHAVTHSCLGFISAPQLFVAPGLPCLICSPASGTRSRRPGFLVRSLHHLSAFANSPDSQTADREKRAVSFNQRECGGHDCRRGFGRPQDFQQSSGFEQIHPEDRERVKKAATQTRQSGMGTILEYRFRHKNGDWMVLESVASVIRNEKGEPEKLVIVNRDITERKKAQEALSRSEASFRSLVEGAPHGIYRATMTGQFLQVNPALQRMLGYDSVQELFKADLATQVFRHSADYERMNELLAESKVMKDTELEWKRPKIGRA